MIKSLNNDNIRKDYNDICFYYIVKGNNTIRVLFKHKNKYYLVLKLKNDEITEYEFFNGEDFKQITDLGVYHNLKFNRLSFFLNVIQIYYIDENDKEYKFIAVDEMLNFI